MLEIPKDDLKFDNQMNLVVARTSKSGTGKTLYDCVAHENHYFDAWKVFATHIFAVEFKNLKPIKQTTVFLGTNF
jgi:hypothetical protein